ncbi:hypothetical protein BJ741DRAFT_586838 [Chytriomyces cf. hyalinus JEL632]|nr:hypothetical protein BJ741DRAFT_586838 [Chytriomyces cf. hyalinus JEL632]
MTLFPMKIVLAVIDCWLVMLFLEVLLDSEYSDAAAEHLDSARISAVVACLEVACREDIDSVWARGNMDGLVVVELEDDGMFYG